MPKPDYNYRINPDRAVQVFGEFTEELAAKLLPQIYQFRKTSEPISVLIHSRGGTIRCLEILLGALRCKDADGKQCRVVTAASGECASAAATLLALGDYSIGYEHSTVYFHGIRLSETEVTMEDAAQLAAYLNTRNREIAGQLAEVMVPRLMLRFAKLKSGFDDLRKECKKPDLSPVECFAWTLKFQGSDKADTLIDRSLQRLKRARDLLPILAKANLDQIDDPLKQDAKVLQLVVRYELKTIKNRGVLMMKG